jgi:hypothetical protein
MIIINPRLNTEVPHQQWFNTLLHWMKANHFLDMDAVVKDALMQIP